MAEEYQQAEDGIRDDSLLVDGQFMNAPAELFRTYSLSLPVPKHHSRADVIIETKFMVDTLEPDELPDGSYYMVDASLKDAPFVNALGSVAHIVEAREDTLKEYTWLDSFIDNDVPDTDATIVGLGGGILLNAAAYIAEKRGVDFISVPTTILAAADSAIGGLVRINKVEGGQFQKSFHKSVYEPSSIVIDPNFWQHCPKSKLVSV